jgi:hypothetical protein
VLEEILKINFLHVGAYFVEVAYISCTVHILNNYKVLLPALLHCFHSSAKDCMPLYDHHSSLSLERFYSEVVTVLHFLKLVFRYIEFFFVTNWTVQHYW